MTLRIAYSLLLILVPAIANCQNSYDMGRTKPGLTSNISFLIINNVQPVSPKESEWNIRIVNMHRFAKFNKTKADSLHISRAALQRIGVNLLFDTAYTISNNLMIASNPDDEQNLVLSGIGDPTYSREKLERSGLRYAVNVTKQDSALELNKLKFDSATFYTASIMSIEGNHISAKKIKLSSVLPLDLNSADTTSVYLRDSKINALTIDCPVDEFYFLNSTIDKIYFDKNTYIKNSIQCNGLTLPSQLSLSNVVFANNAKIDLTAMVPTYSSSICKLYLNNIDPTKIILDYEHFELVWQDPNDPKITSYPNEKKEYVYQQLMEMHKNRYVEGYEKLDIEFKQFEYTKDGSWLGYVLNFINKEWWNYGYDKFKVIPVSIIIFLLFFIVNLFKFDSMTSVYLPKNFEYMIANLAGKYKNNRQPQRFSFMVARSLPIFLYSAHLFWSFKLEIKELTLKNPAILFLIVTEYIMGVISLAYIAAYILSK